MKLALEQKLLINGNGDNGVRLMPPLVMNREEAALLTDRLSALIWAWLNQEA